MAVHTNGILITELLLGRCVAGYARGTAPAGGERVPKALQGHLPAGTQQSDCNLPGHTSAHASHIALCYGDRSAPAIGTLLPKEAIVSSRCYRVLLHGNWEQKARICCLFTWCSASGMVLGHKQLFTVLKAQPKGHKNISRTGTRPPALQPTWYALRSAGLSTTRHPCAPGIQLCSGDKECQNPGLSLRSKQDLTGCL